MLEQLKKESLKKVRTKILLYLGICIVLIGIFHRCFLNLMEGPRDFNTLSIEELPNSYIKGEFYFLIDNFAQYYIENESGKESVTENYYIIPVGEEEYMALEIDTGNAAESERICNETYEYIMGNTDTPPTGIKLKGTINKMPDEVYEYYEDWFQTSGFLGEPTEEEINRVALPYIIQVDYIGFVDGYIVYGVLALIILGFIYSVIIAIKGLSGLYIAPIKKYVQRNESSVSLEQIEADFMNAASIGTVRIGQKWTYYFKGNKIQIIKNDDIVWAYLQETTQKVYGIKAGVIRIIVLYTNDRKKYTYTMRNVNDIYTILGEYSKNHPNILVGFSEDLKKLFKKDFEQFKRIAFENQAAVTTEETSYITNDESTEELGNNY
ncbi:hypothetical protein EDD66_10279 [Mobilisporobacter senegalensis]|uniref:Uncharacterized protein n=1 Tax=Mobilisporobacter senegalensis TaxID=1329262 RepID=A0A3N1XVX4_9FIRM|nr:DUF6709 family protein [Mobilisporobacter senegalensis]ROR30428.1 hypothetical protein EDD66_10279 [Mobilisporobacter senegalensis]